NILVAPRLTQLDPQRAVDVVDAAEDLNAVPRETFLHVTYLVERHLAGFEIDDDRAQANLLEKKNIVVAHRWRHDMAHLSVCLVILVDPLAADRGGLRRLLLGCALGERDTDRPDTNYADAHARNLQCLAASDTSHRWLPSVKETIITD